MASSANPVDMWDRESSLNEESQVVPGEPFIPRPCTGNEIVPLTSETQIVLPSTGDGSLVAPTQSEDSWRKMDSLRELKMYTWRKMNSWPIMAVWHKMAYGDDGKSSRASKRTEKRDRENQMADPMDLCLKNVENSELEDFLHDLENNFRIRLEFISLLRKMIDQEEDEREKQEMMNVSKELENHVHLSFKPFSDLCKTRIRKWFTEGKIPPPQVKDVKIEKKDGKLFVTWTAPKWPFPLRYRGECVRTRGGRVIEQFENIAKTSHELTNVSPTRGYSVTVWAVDQKGRTGEEEKSERVILSVDDEASLQESLHDDIPHSSKQEERSTSRSDQPQLRIPDSSYQSSPHGSVGSTYIPSLSLAHPNNSQVSAMSPAPKTSVSVFIDYSSVKLNKGTFDRANFGPQTNTKHVEANTIEHATIYVHHHSGGEDKSEESSSTSGATGARPKRKLEIDIYLTRSPSDEEHSEPNGKPKRKTERKSNRSFEDLHSNGCLSPGRHSSRKEMVELGEGLFCNKKTPLRQGGRVYKGEQRNGEGMVNMPFAIKFFRIEDSVQLKRYQRALNDRLKLQSDQECKYLTKLAYCGQSRDGELYIVMTLCHVTSLADINLEKDSPDQRKNISLQICRGLAFLHSTKDGREPLAHGNLKPSNVLFSIGGRTVMLSDFGFSKIVDISKTQNKKTSTSYGGTQGWMAAEQERGDQDFIKDDIFSLGLVVVYILYNKHHPFADPGDRTDPVFWQANIMKQRPPNLEPLEEDHLEQDLFRKMLSHDPDRRPIIEEVLQHCMFWSPTKKITFLYEMFDDYLGSESFKKKMVKTEIKKHKAAWKLVYNPMPTISAKTDSNLVTDTTSAEVKIENVDAVTKVPNEIREIIGECWLDRVKEMDEKKGTTVYEKSLEAYPGNSLFELIRYIRNISTHALGIKKNRKQETIQYWVEAFPQLIPNLLKIMLPLLTPEDRKEYAEKWAEPGDIDVSHLLGEMP